MGQAKFDVAHVANDNPTLSFSFLLQTTESWRRRQINK